MQFFDDAVAVGVSFWRYVTARCRNGIEVGGMENIIMNGDHRQEAHLFPRVHDLWKSS